MKKLITMIIIIFIGYIFHYYKYKTFINPYKLYMVFGKKGSGKSSFLIKKALYYQKKGYIVYTNMVDMMITGVRLINPDQLGDFVPEQNSVLLLDEVGMLYDNRQFKNFRTSVRDFYKLQRHYKVIVYLASQTFDIDKKLRDLTDDMYLLINIGIVYSLVRPISKKITLTEATAEGESRIAENLKFRSIFSWKLFKITKYAKYFESFKVPEKPQIPYQLQKTRENETARKKRKKFFNKYPVGAFKLHGKTGKRSFPDLEDVIKK